jgi:4-hydroxybenzoate polyprenyltransferase
MRLPAVFTALADICAGFAVRNSGFQPWQPFVGLLTASAGLYLSGMVFNDLFDRRRDAAERPNRPIPSGRVSPRSATVLATVLMLVGIGSAATVSREALWIAFGLAACILAYDGLLKATPVGPIAMGACRFLNVMLGAAATGGGAGVSPSVWSPPQVFVAAAIGVYVAGVTWFARTEEKASRQGLLLFGAAVASLGMAILAGTYLGWPSPLAATWTGGRNPLQLALLVAVIAAFLAARLAAAIREPSPARVQAAVKVMLLSIITLDATAVLAQTGDGPLALATALLVLPALFVGRWVYVT